LKLKKIQVQSGYFWIIPRIYTIPTSLTSHTFKGNDNIVLCLIQSFLSRIKPCICMKVLETSTIIKCLKISHLLSVSFTGKDLHIRLDTIVTIDVLKAIERTKPSGKAMKDKYAAWQREYESV